MKAPEPDLVRNDHDREQKQQVYRAELMVAPGVDAPRIVVLEPVGTDYEVANDQREMFSPLLGDGIGEIAVALWPVRCSRYLDLDDQEGEDDCEDCIREPSKRLRPRSAPYVLPWVSWAMGEQTRTAAQGCYGWSPRAPWQPLMPCLLRLISS